MDVYLSPACYFYLICSLRPNCWHRGCSLKACCTAVTGTTSTASARTGCGQGASAAGSLAGSRAAGHGASTQGRTAAVSHNYFNDVIMSSCYCNNCNSWITCCHYKAGRSTAAASTIAAAATPSTVPSAAPGLLDSLT